MRLVRPPPALFALPALGRWTALWLCLGMGLCPGSSWGQAGTLSTNLPPLSPALPDAGFSVLRVFGALTLVLALFLAGVWVFKNWSQFAGRRARNYHLKILESRALGGRHALHVVGYQGQRLLLASSPGGVALLSHLPPGDPADGEQSQGTPTTANFVQVLQQAIQQKP